MVHFVNTERINKVIIYFKSFSICVYRVSAVRPAGARRSDRRRRQRAAADLGGRTGDIISVRPAGQLRSDRDPSNSRVTFISAKSFRFLGIPTIHPPCHSIKKKKENCLLFVKLKLETSSSTPLFHFYLSSTYVHRLDICRTDRKRNRKEMK